MLDVQQKRELVKIASAPVKNGLPVLLSEPLPPYWGSFCHGSVYYANKKTNEVQWEVPTLEATPPPYKKAKSDLAEMTVSFAPLLDEWSETVVEDSHSIFRGRVYDKHGMPNGIASQFRVPLWKRDFTRGLIMSELGEAYFLGERSAASAP